MADVHFPVLRRRTEGHGWEAHTPPSFTGRAFAVIAATAEEARAQYDACLKRMIGYGWIKTN